MVPFSIQQQQQQQHPRLILIIFFCVFLSSFYRFHYEYRPEIEADPNKFAFIRLRDRTKEAHSERAQLLGSLQRDVALWFSLGAIATAWMPGAVTHGDVLHAYVVVLMWALMHHYLRRATCWGNK
jgi:hypothetical protein